ncbi:MAG: hypothetical protein K0Q93_2159 [Nocardioidaceae bacterium]|nr:hypothetical protein [Nocardioidaceae bacterium]
MDEDTITCAVVSCIAPLATRGLLCITHTQELETALRRIVALEDDLDITISRQAVLNEHTGGGRPAERPLPFHWDGSDTQWTLRSTATRWAEDVAATAGRTINWDTVRVPARPRHAWGHRVALPERTVENVNPRTGATTTLTLPELRHDDPAALPYLPGPAARAATWLLKPYRLDTYPQIAQLFDEITFVAGRTQHVIDRAPTRWYAGGCDLCGTAMYGRPEAGTVLCPNPACVVEVQPEHCSVHERPGPWCDSRCEITDQVLARTRYDLAERRAWLLDAAEDYLATATEASRAVALLDGHEIKAETIRTWMSRGELDVDYTHPENDPRLNARIRTNPDGSPRLVGRVRLGDVIARARRVAARPAS